MAHISKMESGWLAAHVASSMERKQVAAEERLFDDFINAIIRLVLSRGDALPLRGVLVQKAQPRGLEIGTDEVRCDRTG